MMRWIFVAAVAVPLSGCALPPAVSIASMALDVGSYAVTGKTMTDHGLSAVMDKDCAVIRVVEIGQFCYEQQDFETVATILEPLPDGTVSEETVAVSLEPLPERQTAEADPMILPAELGYLEERADGVVATGGVSDLGSHLSAFAPITTGLMMPTSSAEPGGPESAALWAVGYLSDGLPAAD